ncbi:MAG: porin family protein [Bacteroidales bacterium]
MKKILIVSLLTIFSFSGFSQVSGGLFAGPNLSWFGVDSKIQSNDGVKLGYTFGAMADFPIFDNFLVTTAVKYNNFGGSMNYKNGAIVHLYDEAIPTLILIEKDKNINYNLNYLEIPVGFKGKTNEIGFMSYYMKAGVTPMFRLKSKADITADSGDLFLKNIGWFNFSWFMGAGFEWSLSGNTRFVTEIDYSGGIMNFIKDKFSGNESEFETTVKVLDDFENSDQFKDFEDFEEQFKDAKETYENNPNEFEKAFINKHNTIIRDHRGKVNAVSLKIGILF